MEESAKEGSITFTHIKSGRQYSFSYSLHPFSWYVETIKRKQTFTMLPGSYNFTINVIYGGACDCEVWEKGIILKDLDWIAYLGLIIGSILIIIMGYKKYLGYSRKGTGKRIGRRKYICQKCGAKLSPGYAICLQCGENVQKL